MFLHILHKRRHSSPIPSATDYIPVGEAGNHFPTPIMFLRQKQSAVPFINRIATVNRKAKLAALAEEEGLELPDELFSRSLKEIKAEIANIGGF